MNRRVARFGVRVVHLLTTARESYWETFGSTRLLDLLFVQRIEESVRESRAFDMPLLSACAQRTPRSQQKGSNVLVDTKGCAQDLRSTGPH